MSVISHSFALATLADTQALAVKLAVVLRPGDVVTLEGEVGAGKTTFAQFLIQALSDGDVEVTSPTFTILQTYPVTLRDGTACELYHYDLYRIEHPSALEELGLEEALDQVALIEWPERLFGMKLPVSLALSLQGVDDVRSVTVHADEAIWRGLV